MKNKIWKKPELVVLIRSNSQETVLNECKSEFVDLGPGSTFGGCNESISFSCFDKAIS